MSDRHVTVVAQLEMTESTLASRYFQHAICNLPFMSRPRLVLKTSLAIDTKCGIWSISSCAGWQCSGVSEGFS